jgi:oxalate decarboxylase
MGHYVENTGDGVLRFPEVSPADHFADVSLSRWLAKTPPELVREQLHVDDRAIGALHGDERPIVR